MSCTAMLSIALGRAVENVKCPRCAAWGGIATASTSLVVLGSILLLYYNALTIAKEVFRQTRYSIFLQEDISPLQKRALLATVRGIRGSHDAKEISPEQSRKELLESMGEAGEFLESVTFSKLPALVEFTLQRQEPLTKLELRAIETEAGVDEVVFGREARDRVDLFFFLFRFVGIFLIAITTVAVVYTIRNSIQIGMRIRFEEIGMFKVLGATKWFIRLPYVIEGIFIALASFFLSLSVVYFLFQFVIAGITHNKATYGIGEKVRFFPASTLAILLAALILLGAFSSLLATDKIVEQLEN